MKKRNYEKLIFNLLRLFPWILALSCLVLSFATLWRNHDYAGNVYDCISEAIGYLRYISNGWYEIKQPLWYLCVTIFNINDLIIVDFICDYIIWLVLVELLNIIYDLIIFIPRVVRSMLDRSMKE